MENVGNNNKKLVVVIVVIITLVLSSTYAFLNIDSESGSTTGEACSDVSYSSTAITTSSLVSTEVEPDSDNDILDEGDNPISKITVAQTCEIYDSIGIYIHTNAIDNAADINTYHALKYKLVSDGKIVSSGVITSVGDSLIATVPLTSIEVDYYLYIWVDSTISNGAFNGKTYSGYIFARTDTVSSTITSQEQ